MRPLKEAVQRDRFSGLRGCRKNIFQVNPGITAYPDRHLPYGISLPVVQYGIVTG